MRKLLVLATMAAFVLAVAIGPGRTHPTQASPATDTGAVLIETLTVDALGVPVATTSFSSVSGIDYLIEVSDTVSLCDQSSCIIEADAEYSQRTDVNAPGGCKNDWVDLVCGYEGSGETLGELTINPLFPGDGAVEWGAFDASHVYTTTFTGDGNPIDFQIWDLGGGPNNLGSLTVRIFQDMTLEATPDTDVNAINTSHTVTATVEDDNSGPISGLAVNFDATAGPNAGDTGSVATDSNGQAAFTYTGDGGAGTDTIRVWIDADDSSDFDSGEDVFVEVTKTWYDKFVSGGGQLLEEAGAKRPDWLVISFGGFAASAGSAGYIGEWEVNFHNVGVDTYDKTSFHTTSIDVMNFYTEDPCGIAMNFTATGVWNGTPGYKMIFRAQDAGEPGSSDNARIELFNPGPGDTKVYDTDWGSEFTHESTCVGTARTGLDNGNIQMAVLTP